MGTENLISQEAAEEQISLLEDYYEMESTEDCSVGKKSYDTIRRRLVKHISKGRLEISEAANGILVEQIIKTDEGDQRLVYSEIKGSMKFEMDKATGNVGSMYSLAGSLTGLGLQYILNLKGKNLSLTENLTTFLAIE